MAEDIDKAKTDYASNSAKSKQTAPSNPDRPVIQQVVTVSKAKKGLGTKFKETFVGDSAESVGQYVLFDILIPRVKDLLYETFTGGLERSLFGSSTRSSRAVRGSQLVSKTNYKGISEKTRPVEREISPRGRAIHNFEEILIHTRGEAEQVRDILTALVDQYECATVADLYAACGLTAEHTDLKFGWTDLTDLTINPARGGGYVLDLPRVEELP
jgi:hypothetical protein